MGGRKDVNHRGGRTPGYKAWKEEHAPQKLCVLPRCWGGRRGRGGLVGGPGRSVVWARGGGWRWKQVAAETRCSELRAQPGRDRPQERGQYAHFTVRELDANVSIYSSH